MERNSADPLPLGKGDPLPGQVPRLHGCAEPGAEHVDRLRGEPAGRRGPGRCATSASWAMAGQLRGRCALPPGPTRRTWLAGDERPSPATSGPRHGRSSLLGSVSRADQSTRARRGFGRSSYSPRPHSPCPPAARPGHRAAPPARETDSAGTSTCAAVCAGRSCMPPRQRSASSPGGGVRRRSRPPGVELEATVGDRNRRVAGPTEEGCAQTRSLRGPVAARAASTPQRCSLVRARGSKTVGNGIKEPQFTEQMCHFGRIRLNSRSAPMTNNNHVTQTANHTNVFQRDRQLRHRFCAAAWRPDWDVDRFRFRLVH